jgi:hypothetical protein
LQSPRRGSYLIVDSQIGTRNQVSTRNNFLASRSTKNQASKTRQIPTTNDPMTKAAGWKRPVIQTFIHWKIVCDLSLANLRFRASGGEVIFPCILTALRKHPWAVRIAERARRSTWNNGVARMAAGSLHTSREQVRVPAGDGAME